MQTLAIIGIPAALSIIMMLAIIINDWTTWRNTRQSSYTDDSEWRR